jgi:hypothetical protein
MTARMFCLQLFALNLETTPSIIASTKHFCLSPEQLLESGNLPMIRQHYRCSHYLPHQLAFLSYFENCTL